MEATMIEGLAPGTVVKFIDGRVHIIDTSVVRNTQNVPHIIKKEEQLNLEDEVSKMESVAVEESHSEEIFAQYTCNSLPSSYKSVVHPGDIVEAGSLAAQNLPDATYDLSRSLPEDAIRTGKISDLQLEGILYACQRHQMILPDGKRAGFFLADGTGVGKGRQISGILLDNICRNRNKHIWFSISSDLRHDAQRDLKDIGCYTNIIDGCQQLDKETRAFGLVSDFKEGVLFSTYSTLVSSTQKDTKKTQRLDQLINWCGGKDFDGCLIFDESHKAKHFLPGNEKSSTKVAVAVTNIQRLLPKARVMYCSATGVTDVKNMAFMERLGLWGPGTTFQTFESFLDSLSKRGLGALEMLSMEMKAAGMYVSRGLSYQDTEFHTSEACLTDEQTKIYDKAVKVWRELKRCLSIALSRTGTVNIRVSIHYWGCHQRFFKQLCISMKMPEIIRRAKEALEEGHCVVIGLQTTGEASMEAELDQNDGDLKSFVSLTREILRRFILQFFPTEVHLPDKEIRIDEWCTQAKCMLLDVVDKMVLPNSPLDTLIDELGGPNCVAEMTGRKGFIGRCNKNQTPGYITRTSGNSGTESINVQERNAFMDGSKLVAIISDAASTGISLHADTRYGNKRRRVHITAELAWSADKAVQQLGRSHRSNQSSGPIYQLVTSNLGGERRFAAAVAKRLQSLGAITKGDRRAATGADLTQFNFDTPYGRRSLKSMYEAIQKGQLSGGVQFPQLWKCAKEKKDISLEQFNNNMKQCLIDMDVLAENTFGCSVKEKNLKDVGRFLNRILGLEVEKQNMIFSYFCLCLDAATEAAKREGRYNDGVTDLRGSSIIMKGEARVVFKEAQLGASITKHITLLVDRGVSFTQASNRLKDNPHCPENGFYRSKRQQYGKTLFLLAIRKEGSTYLFTVTRPNTGLSPFEEERNDLLHKYELVQPCNAEAEWSDQYEITRDHCIHGDTCKHKGSCRIGTRISEVHLINGRILSILPALELMVARFSHALHLSREQRNLRVVRVELDNGERLIGLRYPDVLISDVERHLKGQKDANQEKLDFILDATLEAESPIDKRSRTKALTKPLTLHKFFKTKHDSAEQNSSRQDAENNSSEFIFAPLKSLDTIQDTKPLLLISKPVENNNSKSDVNGESGTLAQTINKTKNNSGEISKSVKRTKSVDHVTPKKRQKQTNIFNLMTSHKDVRKTKSKTCPVCQKDLQSQSNSEINLHMDNCLIE